ncbi:hypothetical protein M9458_037220, partial [Cirrhinus mrigala]
DCLKKLSKPVIATTHLSVCSTSVETPNSPQTLSIPPEYQVFQDVFSKVTATHLLPHRPWDCAIDLLPGAKLPKGRVYPLSIPKEYIQEALQQGFICPSTSPAVSSFFFVAKKDEGLRSCIDYRALNEQTVKFTYPLPLVPATLEEFKLDLRSGCNLIHIRRCDEWKTAFITPIGHYEYRVMPYGLSNSPSIFQNFMNELFQDMLNQFVIIYIDEILIYSPSLQDHHRHVTQVLQRLREYQLYLKAENCEFHKTTIHFLGYIITPAGVQMDQKKVDAVFYRRFISHYSQLSAPLTSLIHQKSKTLSWTPEARQAFQDLKQDFCAAPALTHPDPDLRFVVKVDAATLGVGTVLSQWRGEPLLLHPCAFFSKKLSPAEQNYDVGNRGLLAIKLALKEWRHWLEGTQRTYNISEKPQDLTLVRPAGHSFSPGSVLPSPTDQETRIPKPMRCPTFIKLIYNRMNLNPSYLPQYFPPQIEAATQTEPAPPGGPEGKIFIPTSLRPALLDSVHTSPGSGHPGSYQTLTLLKNHYWWPKMAQDVARYVKGCSVCTITLTPCRLPKGKLVPLPIPRRPWSHLGIDFATDLPPSNRYSTIFVVVDR